MASVQEMQRFLEQHGKDLLAIDFGDLFDKVSETVVKRKKRQRTLDDYFNKKKERTSSPKKQSVANCLLLEKTTADSLCKDFV